jgi:branched-chain amino acid transport system permease protein
MESAETSPLAGLRVRSGSVDLGAVAVVLLLLGAAIFLAVGCLQSKNFAQLTVQGVALGSVYGSLALALVLVYRATHVINFAQGELAMLTTYIAYELGLHGLTYWETFAATVAIAFVLGTTLQVALIRPVQHRSVIATVIVTVGLFILIDGVVNWIWGGTFKSMQTPFANTSFEVGGVAISHEYVGMVVVVFASAVLVWALFRFTKLGLAMRAASLRPAAAALVGVRVDAMLAIGWGLAAALGAIAGLMAEPSQIFLSPTFMQPILVYAFAAAVLGGLESPAGALTGGLLIGVATTLIIGYVPQIGSELELPFTFAVLLLVLLVKPSGLFGRRAVRRV